MAEWLWFVLLALASWRVFRLLAEDTILDKPRRRLLRLGDWEEDSGEDPPDGLPLRVGDLSDLPLLRGLLDFGGCHRPVRDL